MTRYVIRHRDGQYWCGANRWSRTIAPARWFDAWSIAEVSALRELPDPVSDWHVEQIDMREAVTQESQR